MCWTFELVFDRGFGFVRSGFRRRLRFCGRSRGFLVNEGGILLAELVRKVFIQLSTCMGLV
jgi:hypothetical protein